MKSPDRVTRKLRLGVNIDHVATIRNARGGIHPDPVHAALLAENAGADGITAHLREDRRHISDDDIARLRREIKKPLNLEMAASGEMLEIALRHKPNAACIVPERRQELTTEGGLDVAGQEEHLAKFVIPLKEAGIRVSLFIDPDENQVRASQNIGADIVELHTGAYCEDAMAGNVISRDSQLERLSKAAILAAKFGLEVHAGHGLTYDTVKPVAAMPQIVELNIGHFLIGEAIFAGLEVAVRKMLELMIAARLSSEPVGAL